MARRRRSHSSQKPLPLQKRPRFRAPGAKWVPHGDVILDCAIFAQEVACQPFRPSTTSLCQVFVEQTKSRQARLCATDTVVQEEVLSFLNTTEPSALCFLSRTAVLTLDGHFIAQVLLIKSGRLHCWTFAPVLMRTFWCAQVPIESLEMSSFSVF